MKTIHEITPEDTNITTSIITLAGATPNPGEKRATAHIHINKVMPLFSEDWRNKYKHFYHKEAQKLYEVLNKTLPPGTLDHLFAIIAQEKASLFMRMPPGVENE